MELQVNNPKLTTSYDGGMTLSFDVAGNRAAAEAQYLDIKDHDKIDLIAKKHREKRSGNANNYLWQLIHNLSEVLNIAPEEIYRRQIPHVGGNYVIVGVPDEAVTEWIRVWEGRGLGWVCEEMGAGDTPGSTDIMCYYGSSEYDTAQMSRLINLVVEECKDNNIETMTPAQLAGLVDRWGKRGGNAKQDH